MTTTNQPHTENTRTETLEPQVRSARPAAPRKPTPGDGSNSRSRPTESTSHVLVNLARDIADLVRKEVELARTEMSEKIDQVRQGTTAIGAGALVAYAGFVCLLVSAIAALALVISTWLAALVVGGVVTLIGGIMLAQGKKKLEAKELTPTRTMHSLSKDAQLAKQEVRRS